jgi:hypothetical protein
MNVTTARLAAQAQPPPRRPDPEEVKFWSVYSFQIGTFASPVAAGAQFTANVNINSDSDFLLQHITAEITTNVGVATARNGTIQLTDTSSNVYLFDQPQRINNVCGTAQLPYILGTPRILPANSTFLLTFQNTEAATACVGFFCLLGRKLFGFDNGDGYGRLLPSQRARMNGTR